MRTVIFSSTEFGKNCLDGLLRLPEFELAGLASTGSAIEISYSSAPVEIRTHYNFEVDAVRLGVPFYRHPRGFSSEECAVWLKACRPELILVLGWYYMMPRALRSLAPRGALGIHASLLPRYRGGAPLTWALINGEAEVGATLFKLEDGVDNGEIFGQFATPVLDDDDISTLYDRVTTGSVRLLCQSIPKIASGSEVGRKQDEAMATCFPQRSPADGCINWTWSAKRVRDFVRAQTRPYPGAFTTILGSEITIWKVGVVESAPGAPGQVTRDGDSTIITCGDGAGLLLLDCEWRTTGASPDWTHLHRAHCDLPEAKHD